MTPSDAAGLATISALAASMQPFGWAPARRQKPTPENTKRQDKAARNKRKQQKASRRKNRG